MAYHSYKPEGRYGKLENKTGAIVAAIKAGECETGLNKATVQSPAITCTSRFTQRFFWLLFRHLLPLLAPTMKSDIIS